VKPDTMHRQATISACGRYRYTLERCWPTLEDGKGVALFVMLNPSKADAQVDDPTIRKCVGFARRWGYNAIEVVNLFAWRATKPPDLQAAHEAGHDVIGPENDSAIRAASARARIVIVAWGAEAGRAYLGHNHARIDHVCRLLHPAALHALRLTKDGHPAHPSRIPYGEPVAFEGRS